MITAAPSFSGSMPPSPNSVIPADTTRIQPVAQGDFDIVVYSRYEVESSFNEMSVQFQVGCPSLQDADFQLDTREVTIRTVPLDSQKPGLRTTHVHMDEGSRIQRVTFFYGDTRYDVGLPRGEIKKIIANFRSLTDVQFTVLAPEGRALLSNFRLPTESHRFSTVELHRGNPMFCDSLRIKERGLAASKPHA